MHTFTQQQVEERETTFKTMIIYRILIRHMNADQMKSNLPADINQLMSKFTQ